MKNKMTSHKQMARRLYKKTSKYTIDASTVNNNPPSEQILVLP